MSSLNAFSTVTVHGLIHKDGVFIPQEFQQGVSKPGNVWVIDIPQWAKSESLPSRPPSNLPPHGSEHLWIVLGETVGSGRVGTVHQATLLTHEIDLPPLVVKVSRHRRSENMEHEAWFYEELESVQGIAVPRCYGFFQVHVEEGKEVSTWNDSRHRKSKNLNGEETGDPTMLSILLLERLGERMAVGQPDYTVIKNDVFEIYDDLARLGIEHVDFRWSNILSANQDPEHPSLGSVCPNHGHAHQWRIVDLDLARKTNGTAEFLGKCFGSNLRRMFNNLPSGLVIEPWQ